MGGTWRVIASGALFSPFLLDSISWDKKSNTRPQQFPIDDATLPRSLYCLLTGWTCYSRMKSVTRQPMSGSIRMAWNDHIMTKYLSASGSKLVRHGSGDLVWNSWAQIFTRSQVSLHIYWDRISWGVHALTLNHWILSNWLTEFIYTGL